MNENEMKKEELEKLKEELEELEAPKKKEEEPDYDKEIATLKAQIELQRLRNDLAQAQALNIALSSLANVQKTPESVEAAIHSMFGKGDKK